MGENGTITNVKPSGLNSYQKLSMELNDAKNELNKLVGLYGVDSKESKKARVNFYALDNKLRAIDRSVVRVHTNGGRYGSSISDKLVIAITRIFKTTKNG